MPIPKTLTVKEQKRIKAIDKKIKGLEKWNDDLFNCLEWAMRHIDCYHAESGTNVRRVMREFKKYKKGKKSNA